MRNGGHGIALAIAAAAMITSLGGEPIYTETRGQKREPAPRSVSPNDHGPVVDTTRESKRARRRRLAKAANVASGTSAIRQRGESE